MDKSIIDKIIANRWFIFSVGLLTIWGELIKPILEKPHSMTWISLFENANWIFIIGQSLLVFIIYRLSVRCNKTMSYAINARESVADILINHQKGYIKLQKDLYLYNYSLEYKIASKENYTINGEIKYVFNKLHGIADDMPGSEIKQYISSYYGLPIKSIEEIASN